MKKKENLFMVRHNFRLFKVRQFWQKDEKKIVIQVIWEKKRDKKGNPKKFRPQICEQLAGPGDVSGCFDQLLHRQACSMSPLRLIKTVRYRMDQVEELLEHPQLQNLKVIYLTRDPRGIMASRYNPADPFTTLELQNQSYDVNDLLKIPPISWSWGFKIVEGPVGLLAGHSFCCSSPF